MPATTLIPAEMQDLKQRRICANCVSESFLRAEINRTGEINDCFYCDDNGPTFSIEEIANRVDRAFEQHYERTLTEPDGFEYAMLRESIEGWERPGEEVMYVIAAAIGIDEGPAEDIRCFLEDRHFDKYRIEAGEEGPFDSSAQYEEKSPDADSFMREWLNFEKGIKTQARFFNSAGQSILRTIFQGLEELRTQEGQSVIVPVGPNNIITTLDRARVFQSRSKLEEALKYPDREIGPPPSPAAAAGRMNARGISVFYGAKNKKAAVAEVRPPVGSWVVTGRFEIIRQLRLLDVAALELITEKGSIFDPGYLRRLERAKFFAILGARITRPVLPDDEPFEYLATQAIADFLSTEMHLDGLIYDSAQVRTKSVNVVLFHHASGVEKISTTEGTTVRVFSPIDTEDGDETNYTVWVKPPPEYGSTNNGNQDLAIDWWTVPEETNSFPPALRLDLESLTVHHISAVDVKDTVFPVTRFLLSHTTDTGSNHGQHQS